MVKAIIRENIKNIMSDRQTSALCDGNDDEAVLADGTFVPKSAKGAAAYFEQGLYDNVVIGNYPRRTTTFRIGARSLKRGDDWWSAFSNFRLYFYGQAEVPSAIEQIQNHETENDIYSLTGVKVGTSTRHLPAGIYIKNGKKLLVK